MEILTLSQKSIITGFLRKHPEFDAIEDKINALSKEEAIQIIKNIDRGCGRIAYGTVMPFPDRIEKVNVTARRIVNRIKGVCGACGQPNSQVNKAGFCCC